MRSVGEKDREKILKIGYERSREFNKNIKRGD